MPFEIRHFVAKKFSLRKKRSTHSISGVASLISEGDIFLYLCSAQLTSFEIDLVLKEINCAEQEYMNMSPSLIELATPPTAFYIYYLEIDR